MRKPVWLLLVPCAMHLVVVPDGDTQGDVYYARCNLKVLDKGSKATLANIESKVTYALDIRADGDAFLEKFVTTHFAGVEQFPEEVQVNIRKAIAKIGRTTEQVYIAMGPPTNVGKSRTNNMT